MRKRCFHFLSVLLTCTLITESSPAAALVEKRNVEGRLAASTSDISHDAVSTGLVGAFRHTNSFDLVGSLYLIHFISNHASTSEALAWGALFSIAIAAVSWINQHEQQDRWQLSTLFRGNRWQQHISPFERRYSFFNKRIYEDVAITTYDNGDVTMAFSVQIMSTPPPRTNDRVLFHWQEKKRSLQILTYSEISKRTTDDEIAFDVCPFVGIRYHPGDDGDQLIVIHEPILTQWLPESVRKGFVASIDHPLHVFFQSSPLQLIYSRREPHRRIRTHTSSDGELPQQNRNPTSSSKQLHIAA